MSGITINFQHNKTNNQQQNNTMPNLNKCQLMGNITREIELRYTPAGTAVADIGLAINRTRTGDNGEKVEDTTFVDITLWGRVAEVAHQYAGKGQPLFVEGRLQMDTWDDKETGQKRSKLKVVGENIQLLGSKGQSQQSAQQPQGNQHQMQGHPMPQGATPNTQSDESLPF